MTSRLTPYLLRLTPHALRLTFATQIYIMRIAINGMGRIGRLLFRRLVGDERFTLVAINDIMDPGNLAYLLRYDSLYGTYSIQLSTGMVSFRLRVEMSSPYNMRILHKSTGTNTTLTLCWNAVGNLPTGKGRPNI